MREALWSLLQQHNFTFLIGYLSVQILTLAVSVWYLSQVVLRANKNRQRFMMVCAFVGFMALYAPIWFADKATLHQSTTSQIATWIAHPTWENLLRRFIGLLPSVWLSMALANYLYAKSSKPMDVNRIIDPTEQ